MSSPLIQNIENLQQILNLINELPEAGIKLPELSNPGTADDLMLGKELIDGEGNVVVGIHNCEDFLLNFEVVGSDTAPENPKENTIWINTSTPITNWAISPDNPYMDSVELLTDEVERDTGKYWTQSSGKMAYIEDANWFTATVSLPYNTVSVTIPTRDTTSTSIYHWFWSEKLQEHSYVLRDANNFTYSVSSDTTSVLASIRITDACSIRANVNNAVNGDVWISTDTYANFSDRNEVTTNGMFFHLLRATQYIDGEWKTVEAKIWKNEKWVRCSNYIYNNGKSVVSLCTKSAKISSTNSATGITPTVGTYSTNFWALVKKGSYTNGASGVLYLYPKVDLTQASTLHARGTFVCDTNVSFPYLAVWDEIGSYANENRYGYKPACSSAGEQLTTTVSLDVSSLSGEYYVGFCMLAQSATCSISVWEIWYD